VLPINGAWGGQTVNDMLLVDVYLERQANPDEITHSLEGGRIGPEERKPAGVDNTIDRELQVGLVMTAATARLLGEWLVHKADELGRQLTNIEQEAEPKSSG